MRSLTYFLFHSLFSSAPFSLAGVEFDPSYKKRRYITPAEEQKARAREEVRKEAAGRAAAAQLLLREEAGCVTSYCFESRVCTDFLLSLVFADTVGLWLSRKRKRKASLRI